jgi:hypothetical protein
VQIYTVHSISDSSMGSSLRMVRDSCFRVQDSGFRVWGEEFGVKGFGFRVWGEGFLD